ncbi:hypothetical protein Lal_00003422 [Lupinus albus]|nr:hypothetical protein Lal_00003422 [Lupinus albus]
MWVEDSLFAELKTALMPIEIAHQKGWENIWLECDSALVVDVFKGNSMVPWRLANNWHRCLAQISPMCFKVSHIFREGFKDPVPIHCIAAIFLPGSSGGIPEKLEKAIVS